jgi:SpoVK/Ycf46/Vps4 family AAA+-type ATPase
VILAGYNKEMDIFISQANTGFPSRFKAVIQFEDYNGEEMMQIFYAMVTRKFKAGMDVLNRAALLFKHIDKIKDGVPGFANARTVRTIYEMIEERAHQRMAENNLSGEDLFILTVDDVSLSKREVNIALGVI